MAGAFPVALLFYMLFTFYLHFQYVVNTEDFNHPRPLVDNVVNDKFKVNKDIYDSERYDFLCGLEDEDKRVELLEIAYERYSSSSDTE